MRRIQASLLLLLFSLGLWMPLLASPPETKLPACCRRDGKHRCAMNTAQKAKGSLLTSRCDQYPSASLAPVSIQPALVLTPSLGATLTAAQATLASHNAIHPQTPTHATSQRGPPAFLL